MNAAFNKISAFAIQASKATRSFVNDGITVGKGMVQDGALARQMAIKAGIGAGAGAAAGVGASYATGDRHAVRDGVVGGVTGGLLGAGWAGRKAGPAAWKATRGMAGSGAASAASSFVETNAVHGPSPHFERAAQPGGLRNGWEKAEFAAGEARESRLQSSVNSMSGAGSPRVRAGNLDRDSSYGYGALPNRYKLPRDR